MRYTISNTVIYDGEMPIATFADDKKVSDLIRAANNGRVTPTRVEIALRFAASLAGNLHGNKDYRALIRGAGTNLADSCAVDSLAYADAFIRQLNLE